MKHLYFLFLFVVLCSCGTKKFKPGKYRMTMDMADTSAAGKMAMGFMAMMDITMDFKENGELIYSAKMGAMGKESNWKWTATSDSLFIDKENSKDRDSYTPTDNGYKLNGNQGSFVLTEIK